MCIRFCFLCMLNSRYSQLMNSENRLKGESVCVCVMEVCRPQSSGKRKCRRKSAKKPISPTSRVSFLRFWIQNICACVFSVSSYTSESTTYIDLNSLRRKNPRLANGPLSRLSFILSPVCCCCLCHQSVTLNLVTFGKFFKKKQYQGKVH